MHLTAEQVDRLLNSTIYSWDVSSLLSGIVDFLEFSESNVAWQREREVRRARKEADELDFGPMDAHLLPQAQVQIVESAEYRFDIGLAQSVRYSGLVAYVTAVEWCAKLFASRASTPVPKSPKGTNEAVHILRSLDAKTEGGFEQQINVFERVVFVRNCVVHAAGLIRGDKHEVELRAAISAVPSFELSTAGFLGESVHISKGAIEALARSALEWIPLLDRECSENGTFKNYP